MAVSRISGSPQGYGRIRPLAISCPYILRELPQFVAEHDPKVASAMLDKLAADPKPKVGAPVGNQNASKGENKSLKSGDCLPPQMERARENGLSRDSQQKLDKIAKLAPDYLPRIAAKEITINRAVELGIFTVGTPLVLEGV